ncbi:hypothetical protein OG21DRAFT_1513704 [Imleria badia]|nr:hypothetical protein OG21DRAFT_1513704 [Imleria badia]
MHHALRLEEILLNIFGHCYSPSPINRQHVPHDLATLARTCRTFKEPALDILWTELVNLSPLVRCVPEASHRVHPGYKVGQFLVFIVKHRYRCHIKWYSFTRPLQEAEWDTIRSYARRVRSIRHCMKELNWDSVKTLFNPPTPDPMFPNLRVLCWEFVFITEIFPLMHHLAIPSLASLEISVVFGDVPPLHSFFQLYFFGDLCPNIKTFRVRMLRPRVGFDECISGLVRRWRNLQDVYCSFVSLDSSTLLHLSRMPFLTNLSFTLNAVVVDHITSSASILLFSKLRNLEIYSQPLELVSRLLPHIQLPIIESLAVYIDSCPLKHILRSHLVAVQNSCARHSLVSMQLTQTPPTSSTDQRLERYLLTLDDLRPCMVFDQLRRLDINIASTVKVTDNDLLELASACPHLEYLLINEEWGWHTAGGITPDGLLQLLQRLGSLRHVCLAIDSRGYTNISPALELARIAGAIPRIPLIVNVADSLIHPDSVEALANFFAGVMQQHANSSSCY